jgi:hypothetical protein
MNRYQPNAFHPILGIAAVAMTALTFLLTVGVPSRVASVFADGPAQAAAARVPTGFVEVAIIPARIEVVGTRDTTVAERQAKRRG